MVAPGLGSVALALNWTVRPGAPLVTLAEAVTVGAWPDGVGFKNHDAAVESVLKKAINSLPTLAMPLGVGWVKSFDCTSVLSQVKPSDLGVSVAQRYGPHSITGASTGPLEGSSLRLPRPLIW